MRMSRMGVNRNPFDSDGETGGGKGKLPIGDSFMRMSMTESDFSSMAPRSYAVAPSLGGVPEADEMEEIVEDEQNLSDRGNDMGEPGVLDADNSKRDSGNTFGQRSGRKSSLTH